MSAQATMSIAGLQAELASCHKAQRSKQAHMSIVFRAAPYCAEIALRLFAVHTMVDDAVPICKRMR